MGWSPLEKSKWNLAIGGVVYPGDYNISNMSTRFEWQVARPKGVTGETVKFLSRGQREFEIIVQITTAEEYATWMSIVTDKCKAPSKGEPYAIAIDHPMLAEHYGVTHARLLEENAPERERQGLRRWYARLRFAETAPPTATTTPVKGGAPSGGSSTPKDPTLTSPRAAEIEQRRETLKELDAQDQQTSQQLTGNDADFLGAPT